MAKEYFSHDYHCRSNAKIRALLRAHGWIGYGLWWAIVEDLYNSGNKIAIDYDSLAYDLRADVGMLKSIIEDFGLCTIEDGFFSSESVAERLLKREEKSFKAKNAAKTRWKSGENAYAMQTHSEGNADGMRDECEGNALNKIKGKKSKGNKIKDNSVLSTPAAAVAACDPALLEKFKNLQDWISKNAPQVAKMAEPLTADQLGKLYKLYNNRQVADMLLKMHNRASLLKNNRSAYLTIRNWLNREHPDIPSTYNDGNYATTRIKELQEAQQQGASPAAAQ